jgi:hypothetical protein
MDSFYFNFANGIIANINRFYNLDHMEISQKNIINNELDMIFCLENICDLNR